MGEQQHPGGPPTGLSELRHVEGGQEGLAEACRENDQGSLLPRLARHLEGRQRLDLDVPGLGSGAAIVLHVAEGQRTLSTLRPNPVVRKPGSVQRSAPLEEIAGGLGDPVP